MDPSNDVTVDIDDREKLVNSIVNNEDSAELPVDSVKIYPSLEEFNKNLPSTVSLLKTPNNNLVYLVGTAHFSVQSQRDVSLVIQNVQPNIVVVELCESRVHILKHDEKTLAEEARDINITKIRNIVRNNGIINGMFYILLLNMSAKLTKELGMAPGGEFRQAMREASKIPNCLVHLGDRPINITLQRAIKKLTFWQTLKLVWRLMAFDENISKEEVEQCKDRDLLEQLMKEMSGEFPAFGEVFVNERDIYLCHSIQIAAKYNPTQIAQSTQNEQIKVVAVMGIGHCAGVSKHWGKLNSNQIPAIMSIPPTSTSMKVFKFVIKYGSIGLVGFAVYKITKPHLPNNFLKF